MERISNTYKGVWQPRSRLSLWLRSRHLSVLRSTPRRVRDCWVVSNSKSSSPDVERADPKSASVFRCRKPKLNKLHVGPSQHTRRNYAVMLFHFLRPTWDAWNSWMFRKKRSKKSMRQCRHRRVGSQRSWDWSGHFRSTFDTRKFFFISYSPTSTSTFQPPLILLPLLPKRWPKQREAKAQKTSPVRIHLYDGLQYLIFTYF